jgi:hypothetical protein
MTVAGSMRLPRIVVDGGELRAVWLTVKILSGLCTLHEGRKRNEALIAKRFLIIGYL